MPVGQKELRRGIDLGVYPDVEKQRREERRLQIAEQGAQIQQQREGRMAGNDEIRTKLDLLRFENDNIKAKAAAQAEERVLMDSIEATKKLAAIPATTAEFPIQLQKILLDHPRALADKAFQEQHQWNAGIHKEWSTQQQASTKLTEQRRYDEAQKASEKIAVAEATTKTLETYKGMGARPKSGGISASGNPAPVFTFGEEEGRAPTPNDAGFIKQYGNAVNAVKEVGDILKKGGLNLNSKWAGPGTDFDEAVKTGKITRDEARTAAGAISAFRDSLATDNPDKTITNLQPHYDNISGKLEALTKTKAAPAGDAPLEAPAAATAAAGPLAIASQKDYEALLPGEEFVFNGKRGKKPDK